MTYKLLAFDFDGTLADSLPFMLEVFDVLADTHGFKRIDRNELKTLRGYDVKRMMQHVGLPLWKAPQVGNHFKSLMAANIARIKLFEGVEAMLQQLADCQMTLAIVTSNSYENVRAVLGPTNASLIKHYECGISLFGKQRKLASLVRKSGVRHEDVLFIGDEVRDVEAAHAEHLDFGAVAWGYTHIEALLEKSPAETFSTVSDIAAKLT